MPDVLAVSRYFPPLGSAGASIRLVKLIKYAAREGWSFTVLTQDPDRPVIHENHSCEFLLNEVPSETVIVRAGNPFFGGSIFSSLGRKIARNSSLPWGLSAAWLAWKKLRRVKPELVFANTPPFSNVAAALALSSLFRVPLVVDVKDDWVGSPTFYKKRRFRRNVETRVERHIIRKASAVITVTPSSHADAVRRYAPLGLDKKFFLIPNAEDLEEFSTLRERERKNESGKFLILTSAAGYHPGYRDLAPFLLALEHFLDRCPQAHNQIELEFLGEKPDGSYLPWLQRILPPGSLRYTGPLDRPALVEYLWQADLFFLMQPVGNTTAVSGTLYEYRAVGKAPVLLFSETGASSSMVVEENLGAHFYFSQVDEASQYIEQVFHAFSTGQPVWIERSADEGYGRREMAEQMIAVWSAALADFKDR